MKNCILEEIQILSSTERKAKKVILDPRRNLILGTNNTGKSSLIKTIYYTFGAEPQTQYPKWKKLNPVSYVKFNIDGVKYSILRNGKFFALFDAYNNVIDTYESIVSGLGPKLAELFDFKIQLPNRQGQLITPPPAFLFLPYYLDQDTGWTKEWNSFKGMGMIPGKKDPIIKYHIGQRTNEYYIAKNDKDLIVQQISEYENEREFSKDIVDKINEKLTQVDFDINLDDFKQEVEELLVECQSLKKIEDKYKITIIDLYNSKSNIEEQVLITLKALQESEKDYDYATETNSLVKLIRNLQHHTGR
ncbi:MAG: hypothetical protein ACJATI_000831 [Halioglobus sp.]|jgi:hypothetical protein